MPLTLAKCGNLGGDVEMVAVVKELALRHPEDTFLLIGRNSGEHSHEIGLPENIRNPWALGSGSWKIALDEAVKHFNLKGVVLTPEKQLRLARIFDNIVGPTFDKLDGFVMWVGQHGTSNQPIPKVDDPAQLTKPQDWCAWYSGWMLAGINRWRDADPWNREEVNLNADARNRHKMRDLKWPLRHPILAQFNSEKNLKHHRYGNTVSPTDVGWPREEWIRYARAIDHNTWLSTVRDCYSRLEVNGLRPGTPFGDLISYEPTWGNRQHFGMFINEARAIGIRPELQRWTIVRDWVRPLDPAFVHGTWSKESLARLQMQIWPAPWEDYYKLLHSVRCTFTTPSSGSGWATAKPWEAFAAGTVCFFHPEYDTQDNILGDAPEWLRTWLRVKSPLELEMRIKHLNANAGAADFLHLIEAQKAHFDKALTDLTYMRMIEERLYP